MKYRANMLTILKFEDDGQFIKIFELLMEISEKSNMLRQVVGGIYFI